MSMESATTTCKKTPLIKPRRMSKAGKVTHTQTERATHTKME